MPRDSTPRILAALSLEIRPVWASMSVAPSRAKAIFCPAATLGAPQTTWAMPSPVSTVANRRRSALGCGSTAVTSPTATPSQCSPTTSKPSASMPAKVRLWASSAGAASIST